MTTGLPDKELIETMVRQGYVTKRQHPTEDLYIYNYTNKCVYDRVWNEATLECRGLILTGGGDVVARPFKKFFNLNEREETKLENLPDEPFEVTIKEDGSLIQVYRLHDKFYTATRGSFISDQAIEAQKILDRNYSLVGLPEDVTLLFEVIYPENRVVLDYGNKAQLILVGARSFSGYDFSYSELEVYAEWFGLDIVKSYPVESLDDLILLKKISTGVEGWVVRFQSGLRVKIKSDEYLMLHKLIFGLTTKRIHEAMIQGDIQELIQNLPEEFRPDVERKVEAIKNLASNKYRYLMQVLSDILNTVGDDRKAFALYVMAHHAEHQGYLFSLYNKKGIWPKILKDLDISMVGEL